MPDPLRKTVSATEASALFDYCPDTGDLRWKVARGKIKPGDLVATVSGGYLQVMVGGVNYKAHRLIWLLMTGKWPSEEIDHRDRDGVNNRWANLREASSSQNKMNRTRGGSSVSGIKGVFLDKRDGKWYARVTVGSRHQHLGRFDTKEEAAAAYAAAAPQFHGDFACPTS